MPTFISVRKAFALFTPVFLAFLLTTSLPRHSAAQSTNASVSGRVTDQQNAVIPNTEVEMKNVDTGLTQVTKTNGDGIYSFPALPPGNYVMSVRKEQFQTVSVTGITLHTQDSLSRNFVLQVGSSAVSITVSAADAMWATSDSPAVSTLVTREFVENMPLNGRSFQDLIALTAGTVSSAQQNGLFSVDGQRDNANYYTVDGVSANIYSGTSQPGQGTAGTLPAQTALGTTQALVSVDALQEFRITTSGYTADLGRQPGGQVQLTSRAGTNEWHGTAFDYLRNTIFDANNWFANKNGIARQQEHQNDFGGTLGGPVTFPGLYTGNNKTFFFFSYEGLRLLLPNFVQELDPTVAFRQAAAPGVQTFLNAFPVPNGPVSTDGITAQFNSGYSAPSNLDAVGIRIDHNLGQKVRLFGRYSYSPSDAAHPRTPASNFVTTKTNTWTVTAGATFAISNSAANDARFNYSESNTHFGFSSTSLGGAVPFSSSLVLPDQYVGGGGSQGQIFFSVPGTALRAGFNVGSSIAEQHQYNFADSLSWSHGHHGLKLGVDYRRLLPIVDFGTYEDFLGVRSLSQVQQGTASATVNAVRPAFPVYNNLSLYGQDHWKIGSRLTVDYGLRWEFDPVPSERHGLNPVAVTEITDLNSATVAPQGTAPYRTQYSNFAPRLGFAWRAASLGSHSLVLRGGFGIFYDTGQAQWALSFGGSTVPPFGSSSSFSDVPLPLTAASVAPPSIVSIPVAPYFNFSLLDPHLKLPYTEHFNLTADFGLTARNTLSGSYVGNQGHRLLETQLYLAEVGDFQFPYVTDNAGFSNYNSFQVQDRGYLARGLQFVGSYTWAHAIDNVSTDIAQFSAPVRGNSNNDIRHVFNMAINYEVPTVRTNGLLRALTGGWLLANRFTAQTGYPFNVTQGTYLGPQNQTFDIYPDLVGNVPIYLHDVLAAPGGWQLNSAAFSLVSLNPDGSPVRQGNLPRNFLKGPAFWNLTSGVERSFPVHESVKLMFRVEAFNIFNHPNFGNIDNFLCDCNPHFGQAFSNQSIGAANQLYATGAPRSWQFMLKLQF